VTALSIDSEDGQGDAWSPTTVGRVGKYRWMLTFEALLDAIRWKLKFRA